MGGGLLAGGGPTGVANAVGGVGSPGPGGALPILGGCPLDAEPGGGMPGGAVPGGGMPGGAIPGGGMPGGASRGGNVPGGAVLLIVGG